MEKRNKISKNILKKIKKDEIQIKPKWHFVIKRILKWISILTLGIFATLIFSITYFFTTSESIPMLIHQNLETWKYLLFIFPIIWLTTFGILITMAYHQFHATKNGYKYKFWTIIGTLCLLTLIPGIILSNIGFAFRTYEFAKEHVPGYENIDMHGMFWSRPSEGLLTGRIINIEDQSSFELGHRGDSWQIDASNANFINMSSLVENDFIRLHGQLLDNNIFIADTILVISHPHSKK